MPNGWRQGVYNVINKDKYIGKTKPIYRSSWEHKAMVWFDNNPDIITWASEYIVVQYISPIDCRTHNYITDFYVEYFDKNGNRKKAIIEVKPENQAAMTAKRRSKSYEAKARVVAVNHAKWAAAKEYCETRSMDFIIMTEKAIKPAK